MREIRLLIIAAGCLVAGLVLVYRYVSRLPALESLAVVSGAAEVELETASTHFSTSSYPVLLVGGGRYPYPDWFPRSEKIPTLIQPGDKISIWSDVDRNSWVWQIEKDGQLLVAYADVKGAVAWSNRYDLYLGIGSLVVCAAACVIAYRLRSRRVRRRRAPALSPAGGAAEIDAFESRQAEDDREAGGDEGAFERP